MRYKSFKRKLSRKNSSIRYHLIDIRAGSIFNRDWQFKIRRFNRVQLHLSEDLRWDWANDNRHFYPLVSLRKFNIIRKHAKLPSTSILKWWKKTW